MSNDQKDWEWENRREASRALSGTVDALVRPFDSEMLDWIESQGFDNKWAVQTEDDYPHVKRCFWLKRSVSKGFDTARDAIANAMSNAQDETRGEKLN